MGIFGVACSLSRAIERAINNQAGRYGVPIARDGTSILVDEFLTHVASDHSNNQFDGMDFDAIVTHLKQTSEPERNADDNELEGTPEPAAND